MSKDIKEIIKKYSSYIKEDIDEIKLDDRFLSVAALNPFIIHNSSPRGVMMSNHISQTLVLDNVDYKIVQTGVEKELLESAMTIKADTDCEVIAVLERHKFLLKDPDDFVEIVIIVRRLDDDVLDIIRIPKFNRYHKYFGFIYNIDKDYIDSLMTGDIIPKDKILAWPNGVDPIDGKYGFGKTLNVAFMTLDNVAEDGFIVSESALEKLRYRIIERRDINIGQDSILLNLNAKDDEEFKAFPDIGEETRDDGIIMGMRKVHSKFAPVMLSKNDLRDYNPIFDKIIYADDICIEKGKVIDNKTYYSPQRKYAFFKGTDEQLKKYSESLINFYKSIISIYESRNKDNLKLTGKNIEISKKFSAYLTHIYSIVESSKENSKIKKNYRNEMLDLYRVELDIEYPMKPAIRSKLSGLSGDKGVIVSIWKDEDMPVDKDGNRADIIMDPFSTISRLNVGRLYERAFNAASRKAKKYVVEKVKEYYKKDNVSGNDALNLPNDVVDDIMENIILDFVKIVSDYQYEVYSDIYKSKDYETMRDLIREIIDEEFYIFYKADFDKKAWEVVLDIENSKYKPVYDKVKFRINGKEIESEENILIAPMYILLLNKVGDSLLNVSSANINHFGFPISVSKKRKEELPFKPTPVKTIGETETRLYLAYGGREFIAELLDRASSIKSHAEMYKNILTAKEPTNIERAIDRDKIDFDGNVGLNIFKKFLKTFGLGFEFKPDEDLDRPYFGYEKDIDLVLDNLNEVEEDEDIDEDKDE